jgi:hypothetical protein
MLLLSLTTVCIKSVKLHSGKWSAVVSELMLLWTANMGLSPGFVVANSQLLLVQRQPRSAHCVPLTHRKMANM